MNQQTSNKEKSLFIQINDLIASSVELRTLVLDYQEENQKLIEELEKYKEDNAKLEKQLKDE
ncbi:hypothetical protein [Staphylococcus caledonicus]|uniref:hypothetical protein n=1 Tax=Staphylococcus caledonicus TaxID=2741333 RepID=UPI0018E4B607|nr:hypothetical protein [Staphylococcus caledonicus]MBI5972045.1 hypothetical protein [Staphylococcus caledonicus]